MLLVTSFLLVWFGFWGILTQKPCRTCLRACYDAEGITHMTDKTASDRCPPLLHWSLRGFLNAKLRMASGKSIACVGVPAVFSVIQRQTGREMICWSCREFSSLPGVTQVHFLMKILSPHRPLTFFKVQGEHSDTKCLKDVFSPQRGSRVDLLGSLKACSQAQEQKNMLKKAFAGAWCLPSAFLGHGQGLYRCMPDGHGYTPCVDKHNISKSFLVFLGQPSRECLRFLPCTWLNSGKF